MKYASILPYSRSQSRPGATEAQVDGVGKTRYSGTPFDTPYTASNCTFSNNWNLSVMTLKTGKNLVVFVRKKCQFVPVYGIICRMVYVSNSAPLIALTAFPRLRPYTLIFNVKIGV
jgi:hypothetical protein